MIIIIVIVITLVIIGALSKLILSIIITVLVMINMMDLIHTQVPRRRTSLLLNTVASCFHSECPLSTLT